MRTLNAHRLLAGTSTHDGYMGGLDIGRDEERALRDARDTVRVALRMGLRDLQSRGVITLVDPKFVAKANTLPPLSPRFRMQGSMKYRTINEPAHKPPQEIDVDDGVYLPTSFVTSNNTIRPVLASRAYFNAVEKILAPLCDKNHWELDRSKPCCVRIRLSSKAHIDLPLYAIPDDSFLRLAEDRAMSAVADSAYDEAELSERVYKALPSDQVMLARRNDDWLESDPRQIEDWFLEAIAEHGEVVRSVSRYLKGWRDYQFTRCKISSILLMQCVVTTFDSLGGLLAPNRDDLALLAVARNLAAQFSDDIHNPILPDQKLNGEWEPAERSQFIKFAQELHHEVEAALTGTYEKNLAIKHLRTAFGSRIPNAPDLISIDGKEAEVTAYRRASVVAPAVPRTTSG